MLIFILLIQIAFAAPAPISLCIPECKIVRELPSKEYDFAFLIPGHPNTYIYEREEDYYEDYRKSYFGVTKQKAGWDCMRHYEILASGCIPYFLDLNQCDQGTLCFFPKDLVIEAMNLPGVSYLHIDHAKFNKARYNEILQKLLDHTRKYLTCRAMANYLLKSAGYSGEGKVLFLSPSQYPDYLRDLTLIGLRETLGEKLIEAPKIYHVYKSYTQDIIPLYGKGMSYTRILDDLPLDRNHIPERIFKREFELIIYGAVHRGLPHHDLVTKAYEKSKIVYLCGEDIHNCPFASWDNLFMREGTGYLISSYPLR